jgi:hypothetical protein
VVEHLLSMGKKERERNNICYFPVKFWKSKPLNAIPDSSSVTHPWQWLLPTHSKFSLYLWKWTNTCWSAQSTLIIEMGE